MKIQSFEDIKSWQKSQDLTLKLYRSLRLIKDYSFKDQVLRSAVSISSNIAEGFERNTDKELANFLYIAKGSAGELRSQLYLARQLGYISEADFNTFKELVIEITRLISAFIKSLKI